MSKSQKKTIQTIIDATGTIASAKDDLESIKGDLEAQYESLSESAQEGQKGESLQAEIELLQAAIDDDTEELAGNLTELV